MFGQSAADADVPPAPVAGRCFRIITSNPPYVAEGDPYLEALQAEPDLALTAGPGGLEAIETLARDCMSIIDPDGHLFVEHGADQREAVADIFATYGWGSIRCYDDYAGLPRVTSAQSTASETS